MAVKLPQRDEVGHNQEGGFAVRKIDDFNHFLRMLQSEKGKNEIAVASQSVSPNNRCFQLGSCKVFLHNGDRYLMHDYEKNKLRVTSVKV